MNSHRISQRSQNLASQQHKTNQDMEKVGSAASNVTKILSSPRVRSIVFRIPSCSFFFLVVRKIT